MKTIEPVTKLPVRDAIVRPPVTVDQEMDVAKAAKLMRTVDVGSLMVVDKGKMIGILTEGDILNKVVSKDRQPSKVKVKEIMNRPVICIEPDMDIVEAAKKMAKLKIRRLPVVENGEIIGIVSERDIIRLSPVLIDITRECAMINRPEEKYDGKIPPAVEEYVPGKCEECGKHSEKLREIEGKLICAKCIEG